jgi:hypothetical protein
VEGDTSIVKKKKNKKGDEEDSTLNKNLKQLKEMFK